MTTYGANRVNLHSKICLHTHPYVGVDLKSGKRKIVRKEWSIRVDMEIYLQHGLQQKCAGLVSTGCSQRDDLSSNSVFNFIFLYYILLI